MAFVMMDFVAANSDSVARVSSIAQVIKLLTACKKRMVR